MTELKRATVKCHGKFKTSLSINRDGVSISFTAERKTVDLNRLAALNAFHDGPDLYASTMNKFHVNLSEMDGKWYLMIKGLPYPIKYCPNCGRKLDENTKYEMTDWL